MRTSLAIVIVLFLSSCNDRKAEEIAWGNRCLQVGFTGDQCGLLWEQAKAAIRADNNATVGIALGSAGIATSSAQRR